ncbi:hypothetical protein EMIT079MI2_150049 [Bacillus sp. IT-79MI2]
MGIINFHGRRNGLRDLLVRLKVNKNVPKLESLGTFLFCMSTKNS